MTHPWAIRNRRTGQWWNNTYGWGSERSCNCFTDKEKGVLRLPIDGEWRCKPPLAGVKLGPKGE
jgi:hypothetical protein